LTISETCGNCGSSLEIDRNDEVGLWREWQKNHICKTPDKEIFFSSAAPLIEQSETKMGFAREPWDDDETE